MSCGPSDNGCVCELGLCCLLVATMLGRWVVRMHEWFCSRLCIVHAFCLCVVGPGPLNVCTFLLELFVRYFLDFFVFFLLLLIVNAFALGLT